MQIHPVLGSLTLGYSPFIGRQRQVVATRLTLTPAMPAKAVPDADVFALIEALQAVWPVPAGAESMGAVVSPPVGAAAVHAHKPPPGAEPLQITLRSLDGAKPVQFVGKHRDAGAASAGAKSGPPALAPVSLNVADEAWLRAMLEQPLPPQFMLEVPAFMAAESGLAPLLSQLQQRGTLLLLKGRPLSPLPPEVLACFSHAMVESEEERRALPAALPGMRRLGLIQSGVRTRVAAGEAFERDAVAVLGWPLDDPLPNAGVRQGVPPDVQVVLQLINGVDRELPVSQLELLLKREPTLAYRLMRYLNSPAFGLTVEITSFAHALMLLGSQRLKRWLVLLLASADKGNHAPPLVHAAVRRGLMMEELARRLGEADLRGEMFICGVFSLLDRLLNQRFADIWSALPVSEAVQQAVLGQGGLFAPYLALVRAVEQEAAYDTREAAEGLMLSMAEVNRALLAALLAGRQLDG
jgi:c-di-GMP phosphodiesterase